MGTVDIVTKEYMRGNAVFADAFNYLIYGGKKVIDPAGLTEVDTAATAVGKKDALQKYRDVLKAAVIKQDEKMSYVLLGVENQTDIHKSIEMNAARVIKTITNTPIEVSEEKEAIEMCKAIEDLIFESEARGRAEGETRGEAKGMIEICLDMNFSKEDILKKLQDKLNISLQQAEEYFKIYGIKND